MNEASKSEDSTPTIAPDALCMRNSFQTEASREPKRDTDKDPAPDDADCLGHSPRVCFSHQVGPGDAKGKSFGSQSLWQARISGNEGKTLDERAIAPPLAESTNPTSEILVTVPDEVDLASAPPSSWHVSGTTGGSLAASTIDDESRRSRLHSRSPIAPTEMLAVALLIEDEGTTSQAFSSAMPPDNALVVQIARADPVSGDSGDSKGRWKRHYYLLGFVGIVLVLGSTGLILGLLLGENGDAQTANTTSHPEFSIESFIEFEIPAYSREAFLADGESPQAKAILFLSHDPQLSSYTAARRLTRYSLAVLYFSLNSEIQGAEWNHTHGWATNTSECDWYTTFRNKSICNSSGTFTTLELEQNQLFGFLPTEIELLTDLNRVKLTKNTVRGSIPSEIENLDFLSFLDLSENEFGGTIPSTLSNMSALRHLDLYGNVFVGVIPQSLFGGPGDVNVGGALLRRPNGRSKEQDSHERIVLLEYVCLGANSLQGTIPTTIGHARKLNQVTFRNNNFEGVLPNSLSALTLLRDLGTFAPHPIQLPKCALSFLSCYKSFCKDVRDNLLTGSLDSILSIVPPSTAWLDLGQNMFSGTLSGEVGRHVNLTYLGLDANNLEGTLPTQLGLLTNLEVLYLDNTSLRGTIPTEMCVFFDR
jgi:hypothetical protein